MVQPKSQWEAKKDNVTRVLNDPSLKSGIKYHYIAHASGWTGGYPGCDFGSFRLAVEASNWPGIFLYGVGICTFIATPAQAVALANCFRASVDGFTIRVDYKGLPKQGL